MDPYGEVNSERAGEDMEGVAADGPGEEEEGAGKKGVQETAEREGARGTEKMTVEEAMAQAVANHTDGQTGDTDKWRGDACQRILKVKMGWAKHCGSTGCRRNHEKKKAPAKKALAAEKEKSGTVKKKLKSGQKAVEEEDALWDTEGMIGAMQVAAQVAEQTESSHAKLKVDLETPPKGEVLALPTPPRRKRKIPSAARELSEEELAKQIEELQGTSMLEEEGAGGNKEAELEGGVDAIEEILTSLELAEGPVVKTVKEEEENAEEGEATKKQAEAEGNRF